MQLHIHIPPNTWIGDHNPDPSIFKMEQGEIFEAWIKLRNAKPTDRPVWRKLRIEIPASLNGDGKVYATPA